MVVYRLELEMPDVVDQLAGAPPEQLRRIARAACELTRSRYDIDDERYRAGWRALTEGRFGESDERAGVSELVEELDEAQLDVQDAVEAGRAADADHETAFARARTANTLVCALDGDATLAACESLYEANAVVEDDDAIRALATE